MSKQSKSDGICLLHWTKAAIILLIIVLLACRYSHAEDIPEAPMPNASIQSLQRPVPPRHEGFYANRLNRNLAMADLGVRLGDAVTTHMMMANSCKCMYEQQLPKVLSESRWGMIGYSLAVSAGIQLGSAYLWNHHHHKLARAILFTDIGADGEADVHNLIVYSRRSKSVPGTQPVPHAPILIFHPGGKP